MLNWMLTGEDKIMRAAGVFAIGKLANPRFISNLISYAKDNDEMVRCYTIEAIAGLLVEGIENRRAMMVILDALNENLPETRSAAIRALGKIRTTRCIRELIRALGDNNFEVHKTARETIYNLGDLAIPSLIIGLEDSNIIIQGACAVLLGRLGREIERLQVLALSRIEKLYDNLAEVVSLRSLELPEAIMILEKTLLDKSKGTMRVILEILTALVKEEGVSNIILKSLNSADSRVRANAIETLENTSVRNVVRSLEPYFADMKDEERLKIAATHIKVSTYDNPLIVLKNHIKDENSWLKAITIYTIGELWKQNIYTNQFWDNIFANMIDKSAEVREAAIEALEKHPEPQDGLEERIRDVIADTSMKVSQRAIQYLVRLSPTYKEIFALDQEREVDYNMLSTIEKAIFLKSVTYFDSMTSEQLKVLSNICYEVEFSKDQIVFEQGEIGDALYIIITGSVLVLQKDEEGKGYKELAQIGEKKPFGEMSLFADDIRSASIKAKEQARLLVIQKERFIELLRQYPDLSSSVIKELVKRLRTTNTLVSHLREELANK